MNTDLAQLQTWLNAGEDEHLEFKEAKNRYDFEELVKYCVALANEGGGTMILGVTDKRPPPHRRQPGFLRSGAHKGRPDRAIAVARRCDDDPASRWPGDRVSYPSAPSGHADPIPRCVLDAGRRRPGSDDGRSAQADLR